MRRPAVRISHWLLAVLVIIAAAGVGIGSAAASPLEDAKKAGLVGEQPDGYVGLVTGNATPDVVALVRDINAKRRIAYLDISKQKGTPVEDVAAVAAEKVFARAQPGDYLLVNGNWVRK